MNIEIANRLLQLRKDSGLSQEDLAEKLGISRQSVSKWERAEASPDTDNLIALAQLYGVSLDDLLMGGSDAETKAESKVESNDTQKSSSKTVHIGKDGIHVVDDDEAVDISWDGIHVKEREDVHIHIDDNAVYVDGEPVDKVNIHRRPTWNTVLTSVMTLLTIAVTLLVGFLTENGWRWVWILFLFIPIWSGTISAIRKRRLRSLPIVLIVTAAYLLMGMLGGLWHPWWIMFLIIPLWYTLVPKSGGYVHGKDDDDDDDDDDADDARVVVTVNDNDSEK